MMKAVYLLFMIFGIANMQHHPGDDLEPKPKRRNLKGPGTGSKTDWSFCSKDNPCDEGRGDCDSNEQCKAGLECGIDNCRSFHPDAHRLADCCVPTQGQCVVDTPLRLLTHFVDLGGNVSPERCIEACSTLEKPGPKPKIPGYVFAGVENGNECFCGNSNISSVWHAPSSECNSPCSGNSNKICGGKMRMNIYETGLLWTDGESEDLNLQALPKCKSVGTFKNTESFSGYKSYKYFPQKQKNCFQFEAKSEHDVHVGLDSDEDDSDIYEIVIGGYGNTLSMVRRGKQGPNLGKGTVDKGDSPGQKGWTETPGILSKSEFRGFWITYEYLSKRKLLIEVGKAGETKPFMTGLDKKPLKSIRFFGLNGWATNTFKF